MKEDIQQDRIKWYGNIPVIFELLKCMKLREVVFSDRVDSWKTIRGMNIKSFDYMTKEVFKVFHFLDKDYNVFISSASYKSIPAFTYNLSNRSLETSEWFENQAGNEIFEYDCVLDFDCKDKKDFNKLYMEVYNFYMLLKNEGICFYVIYSGNNFQIVLPSFLFEDYVITYNTTEYKWIIDFTNQIKHRFKLEYLDLKNTGVYNRLMKCPYSLVENKVVLPLRKMYDSVFVIPRVSYVLDNLYVRDRGVHHFNMQNGKKTNVEYFKSFCKRYYIILK